MNKQLHIGVQSFGLGNSLQADLEGTIRKLKMMGFSSIEPLLVPAEKQGRFPANMWSHERLKRAVAVAREAGLAMPSAHIAASFGSLKLPEKKLIDELRLIMHHSDIRYFVFSGMFKTDKAAKNWGCYLQHLSDALEDTDAIIVYHNHDVEFAPNVLDGKLHYPMDTFFEYAGPKVKLQLDIGWAGFAGDERKIFDRYKDRIISLHCKDFYDGVCRQGTDRDAVSAEDFAPIGLGSIKTAALISEYLALPNTAESIVIDQDKCAGDRFEELQTGLANIRRFIQEADTAFVSKNVPKKGMMPPATLDKNRLSLMTFAFAPERLIRKLTVEDTLRLAVAAGVPCVDLSNIGAKDIPAYVSAMNATGVAVNCYIANISFFASGTRIREKLEKQMSIAAEMKAHLFMIVPYGLPTELKKARKFGKAKVRELLISGFQMAVTEAQKNGLTVCFETTPHDELALSSSEDCLYILNAVDGLKLVFDTANMLPAGEAPLNYYEKLKESIVHVHLKDVILTRGKTTFLDELTADGRKMNCCVWGNGEIPIAALYDRMIQDGYLGAFAIEYARPSGINPLATHIVQLKEHFRIFEA